MITCCILRYYYISVLAATAAYHKCCGCLPLLPFAVSGFKYLEVGSACKQGLAKDELRNAAYC